MPSRPRVTFLLPVIGDAHHRLRIDALGDEADVRVMAFRRRFHDGKPGGPPVEELGTLDMGRYGLRLGPYLAAWRRIRRAAATTDVFYVFGLDLAVLCLLACIGLARPPRLVHEVLDIRAILTASGTTAAVFRRFDRWVARRADLLVVTSPEYVSGYYLGCLGVTPRSHLVVENRVRPDAPAPRPDRERAADDPLTIGYFGVLRCRRSLEILAEAVRRADGRLRLLLRGIPLNTDDLLDELAASPHVEHGGPFVSPDDLPAMYGAIDVLWACYPHMGPGPGNWRWARTKRFYEGLRYGRPLIVAAGTRDAARAQHLDAGIEVDLAEPGAAVATLLGLRDGEVGRLTRAVRALPTEVHTETDDYAELQAAVHGLARGGPHHG